MILKQKMEFNKLRPETSQWRAPLLTAEEARARALPQITVSVPSKTAAEPPKGRGGDLWQKFYKEALVQKHPLPEKLADSLLRARERSLALAASRHKVLLTLEKPKAQETSVNEKAARKGRVIPHEAQRCKALTLEGRRCGFKSTCGDFCKKHAVVEKI